MTRKPPFPRSEVWKLLRNRKTWLDTGLGEKAGQQEMRDWLPTRVSGRRSRVSGRQCMKMQDGEMVGEDAGGTLPWRPYVGRELCI